MFCPNCRKELPEGTKFCGGCGTRVAVPVEQPVQPVQPVQSGQESAQYTEPVFDPPIPVTSPAPREKKAKIDLSKISGKVKEIAGKIPAKYLKIGGIAVAVLVVAIVLICVFSGGGSTGASGIPDGALYLKEGQLYYSDYSKKAPYEISGDLLDDASSATLRSYASDIAYTIHVTGDGKTMFFLDKLDTDGTGTLYYRSLSSFSKDAEKIASGVSRYTVSENGKLVTFLKNGTLYQYDMKEETKLEKDVSSYRVSSDGKIIYYKNTDGAWYVMKNGEDEKIGSDITIERITEDYSTVYYLSDGKLYRKTIGEDKEKLLSDVAEITDITDDGTFYYAKLAEMTLSEFFVEDTDEYDGLMEMLAEEPMNFYEIGYFNGKTDTVIGENCGEMSETGDLLYYQQYDISGIGTITLTQLVEYYYDSEHYYVVDAAHEMLNTQLMEAEVTYIASSGTASALELDNVASTYASQDGSTVYVLCDVDENGEGTLHKVTMSGDKIKSVEEVDTGVYSERGRYYASHYGSDYSDYFVYFKDVQEEAGDLYANGTLVDSDVYVGSTVRYNPDAKELVYYGDYDVENSTGTLRTWNGKEIVDVYDEVSSYEILDNGDILVSYDEEEYAYVLAVWDGKSLTEISDEACTVSELENGDLLVGTDYSSKYSSCTLNLWNGKELKEISEDVYDYSVMPNGEILYLYDYSTSKYEGELYLFTGRKSQLVDEDVAALIELPGTVTHYFN